MTTERTAMPPVAPANEDVERLCDEGVLRPWKFWCSRFGTLTYEPASSCGCAGHKLVLILEDPAGVSVAPQRPTRPGGQSEMTDRSE